MLYAIIFEAQKEQITKWCWGPGCGKAVVGAVDLGIASAIVCRHDECPHLDKQMDEPMCEVQGEPVTLRKLKEV